MKRKIWLWLAATFLFIAIVSAAYVTNVNTESDVPRMKLQTGKNNLDLCVYFDGHPTTSSNLLRAFPYGNFFDSVNYWNVSRLKECLQCLDTKFSGDQSMNREVLTNALTLKLEERLKIYYTVDQMDSLLILLQWAERFKSYAEIEPNNALLYGSIYDYWINVVSKHMEKLTIQKPSLKYDFKYKYIRARLQENNAINPVTFTPVEKGLQNMIYGRWGHFATATWNQTMAWQKTVVVLAVALWFYGIYSFLAFIIKKIRK